MIDWSRISVRYGVVLEYNGSPIMDQRLAKLLRLIDEKGSLLSASRIMGIPYSRAWEMIVKVERIIGEELVRAFRGGRRGGGALLTETARRLLEIYGRAEEKLYRAIGQPSPRKPGGVEEPDMIVAYSHDPLIEIILEMLRGEGYSVDGLCIGSGLSLATLTLGESDIACIHLYDPDRDAYNTPYIEKYWLMDRIEWLGGFMRELVFALRPGLRIDSLDELLEGIITGRFRIVNRNRGSGTRVYLDHLLNMKAAELGVDISRIRGYRNEVYTHLEAAKQVASGKADTGLMLRYAAELYGLKHIHARWERYECIALKDRIYKESVKKFREKINSKTIQELIKQMSGYKPIT